MSKSNSTPEKRMDELMEELKRVNAAFPKVEELDGWVPREVFEEKGTVLAAREEEGLIVFQDFSPIDLWKKVYDLMVLRKKIMDEMGKMMRKMYGPTVFTSREFAENGFIE